MNNDPNRRNRDNDDIAATPVTGTSQRRFNPLWLLLLLLIPLLLLPFCHHRDADQAALGYPAANGGHGQPGQHPVAEPDRQPGGKSVHAQPQRS